MSLTKQLKKYTKELTQLGLIRARQLVDTENTPLIHFDSNDYLSLSKNKEIAAAYQKGFALYPSGSGASMLASGYHPNHQTVELAFAKLLEVDACLLFSSGYAANLAITALLGKLKAHCFIDKEIHASIYDGLAQSKVSFTRYLHHNVKDFRRKIEDHEAQSALFVEGIFSMSGQMAQLTELASLCKRHQVELIVDEAHSFGVLGKQGKGAVASHGLTQKEVPLRVIPLGKAFAAQGAIVAGKAEWMHALMQAGRSFIYSTAPSPALSYGLAYTLDYVVGAEDRRTQLMQLIDLFKSLIKSSPLNWAQSSSPIQQLQLGCPHLALYYAQELRKEGISCAAMRTPTVSRKASGLRIVLNYNHTHEQIHTLVHTINRLYEHTHTEIR